MVPPAEGAILLTNLLNAAGAVGYKIEVPKPDDTAVGFELANGSYGMLAAARGNTKSADEFAGLLIGNFADACKGEFLSGKQSLPSTDGSVVRKVVTTCRSNGAENVTETTVIRRSSGFLLALSQSVPPSVGTATAPTPEDRERGALVDAAMRLPEGR